MLMSERSHQCWRLTHFIPNVDFTWPTLHKKTIVFDVIQWCWGNPPIAQGLVHIWFWIKAWLMIGSKNEEWWELFINVRRYKYVFSLITQESNLTVILLKIQCMDFGGDQNTSNSELHYIEAKSKLCKNELTWKPSIKREKELIGEVRQVCRTDKETPFAFAWHPALSHPPLPFLGHNSFHSHQQYLMNPL